MKEVLQIENCPDFRKGVVSYVVNVKSKDEFETSPDKRKAKDYSNKDLFEATGDYKIIRSAFKKPTVVIFDII